MIRQGSFPARLIRSESGTCRQIQAELLTKAGLGGRFVDCHSPYCWDCPAFVGHINASGHRGGCPGCRQRDFAERPLCFLLPDGRLAAAPFLDPQISQMGKIRKKEAA